MMNLMETSNHTQINILELSEAVYKRAAMSFSKSNVLKDANNMTPYDRLKLPKSKLNDLGPFDSHIK